MIPVDQVDKIAEVGVMIFFVVLNTVLFIMLCDRLFNQRLKKKYELASRVLMFLIYDPATKTVRMCCAESGFISESPYISVMMEPPYVVPDLSSVKIHSTGIFTVSTKIHGTNGLNVEMRDSTGELLLLQCTVKSICDLVVKLYEVCRHESLHKYYEYRRSLDFILPDTSPIYYPVIDCVARK